METISLKEKVVLVTGGNTGIGYGIVGAVAALEPACIYLCARNKNKAEAALATLAEHYSNVCIRYLALDLTDLSSVRECARQFNETNDRLDLLFLNAGISSRKPGTTKDGYEVHFGVNYLGHLLLTQLLMPKMLLTSQNADVRVVAVSSISGLLFPPAEGVSLDHLKTSAADLAAIARYGQSKLAMILAMQHLAKLYPSMTFTSLCPGNVKTDLWQQTDGLGWFTNTFLAPLVLWLTGITVEEAVKLPMWCALGTREGSPNGETVKSGTFYHPTPGKMKDDNKFINDVELETRLWYWTEKELVLQGGSKWPSAN